MTLMAILQHVSHSVQKGKRFPLPRPCHSAKGGEPYKPRGEWMVGNSVRLFWARGSLDPHANEEILIPSPRIPEIETPVEFPSCLRLPKS